MAAPPPAGDHPVAPEEIDMLADLVAAALHDAPVARWLVPEPAQRTHLLSRYLRLLLAPAVRGGTVLASPDRAAVAVWHDLTGAAPPTLDRARLDEVCGMWAYRFAALTDLSDRHRPGRSHHHLLLVATHPDRRGQGLGRALLDAYHARLDAQAGSSWVTACGSRTCAGYLRRGYRPRGVAFRLPAGPVVWPLWRGPGMWE